MEEQMLESNEPKVGKKGFKDFVKLIASTNPPKLILILALILTLIQTTAGLIVPLMTKGLIDGLTASALNKSVIWSRLVLLLFKRSLPVSASIC